MAKKIVIATTKGQHQTLELKHNVAQEEIDELEQNPIKLDILCD